ncbi:MAG: YdcF family protein [Rhizomicrobium sp.]
MADAGVFAVLKRIVILLVVLYAAGFVVFVTSLPRTPHDLRHIQGVVALTGGDTRLDAAVALFEKGVGERLLISGVNPQTSREDLKKRVKGGARFDCCADLGYAAEDTHGNAREAASWAQFHHYRRILLVTARYHMPRSLSEFQLAMPNGTIIPYPVDPESIHLEEWWHDARALLVLHGEYAKYLAVTVLTAMGLEPQGPDRSARNADTHAAL